MKKFIRLSILMFTLLVSSCHFFNDGNIQFIWMEAPVYQCCNAWDAIGDAEDSIESRVRHLFLSEGILVLEDELDDSGEPLVCVTCCLCPTEFIIRVRIPVEGQAKAEEWGFSVF